MGCGIFNRVGGQTAAQRFEGGRHVNFYNDFGLDRSFNIFVHYYYFHSAKDGDK